MDTLTVDTQPAVIDTNFEVIKAQLTKELKNYDVVVTIDTVKEAKARATELNKLSGEIDSRRKAAVAEISAPIKSFEAQAKELTGMCQTVRQRILEQVKVFEAETLAVVRDLLQIHRDELYREHGVREEYQRATVAGMEKLSWLTAGGKLTTPARSAVAELVMECATRQQKTDLRLSELENRCHRAGLHSPLTREHVAGILDAPDEIYTDRLGSLIDRELIRQEETERRAREAVEREHAEAETAEREAFDQAVEPDPEPEPGPAPETESPRPAHPPASAKPADTVAVTIELRVKVKGAVSPDTVKKLVLQKLADAGVSASLHACTAEYYHDEIKAAA